MHRIYDMAKDDELQVRVDLDRPESCVQYRFVDEKPGNWRFTALQRADVTDADDALVLINDWLDTQATN